MNEVTVALQVIEESIPSLVPWSICVPSGLRPELSPSITAFNALLAACGVGLLGRVGSRSTSDGEPFKVSLRGWPGQ